jgi:predicted Zn-dependent peptidase
MAFNGTKNFKKQELVDYLESIGMRFGPELNAYTSFDETVYNLTNVPVDSPGLVDTCLLILNDIGVVFIDEFAVGHEMDLIPVSLFILAMGSITKGQIVLGVICLCIR